MRPLITEALVRPPSYLLLGGDLTIVELILSVLRLPIDRWLFENVRCVTLISGVHGREISIKNDLQEEEQQTSHQTMALSPAEARLAYLSSGVPGHQSPSAYQRHYGPDAGGQSGDQGASGPNQPSYDYAGQPASAQEPAGAVEGPSGSLVPVEGQAESGGASSSLQARTDLPAVRALNVKCEKNHMTVNIVFDRPFYGLVFSKGHYNDQKCVHLPANSGQTTVNFDIHLGKCGMSSSDASGNAYGSAGSMQAQQHPSAGQQQQPNGLYIENTIIIQYDPQVQEIFDQARKLRCTWYDYYEKSVTFRPYNVDMLDAVTANFLGDNIQCWMQIQVGKGPWSSEVAGIVKIGQTMTMVLAIKDDENRFDMLVRNCVAHDGKHQPIQLVDEYGCVARPKIMSRFQKVRNFGPAATVVSYAHFQAFKFPDSMSVHFQCVIQVCRYECPEPVCSHQPGQLSSGDSTGAGPPADYATSGTELVSSKELPATSGTAFKVDETQGRVQVKLDTSMMAGLQRPAPSGPLPPHLLHTAGSGGHAFLSSASAQRPALARPHPSRSGQVSAAPAGGRQTSYYSPPYGQHRMSSASVHRMGETMPTSGEPNHHLDAPERALSTIAAPRSLRIALPTGAIEPANMTLAARRPAPNHRYRRSPVAHEQSTAVKTHKTIQVVSPDDMAFAMSNSDDLWVAGESGRRQTLAEEPPEGVCFSFAKLMLALTVTLAAAAASVVAIAFMVLRQRAVSEGDGKLATIYDIDSSMARASPEAVCGRSAPEFANNHRNAGRHRDRQDEEIEQRNNYLARFYSQFIPATYWTQR